MISISTDGFNIIEFLPFTLCGFIRDIKIGKVFRQGIF